MLRLVHRSAQSVWVLFQTNYPRLTETIISHVSGDGKIASLRSDGPVLAPDAALPIAGPVATGEPIALQPSGFAQPSIAQIVGSLFVWQNGRVGMEWLAAYRRFDAVAPQGSPDRPGIAINVARRRRPDRTAMRRLAAMFMSRSSGRLYLFRLKGLVSDSHSQRRQPPGDMAKTSILTVLKQR